MHPDIGKQAIVAGGIIGGKVYGHQWGVAQAIIECPPLKGRIVGQSG